MKHLNEYLNEAGDVGHYERIGNQTIADSNFVNYSKGILPNSELVHLGMGDFALKTPKGEITFSRSGSLGKGIGEDFVGRPHRVTDNKGGKLIEELIKLMTKKKKAVLSGAGLDEASKEETSDVKTMRAVAKELNKAASKALKGFQDAKTDEVTNELDDLQEMLHKLHGALGDFENEFIDKANKE